MHIARSSFRESDVMFHDVKLSDHGLSKAPHLRYPTGEISDI